jgi:hypothetical protein
MAVSETSGKIYDIGEVPRLEAFIKEQQDSMDKIDKEKSVQNNKILQYTLILTGVVVSLLIFNKLINKKK